LVRVKGLALISGLRLFNGFVWDPAVLAPKLRVICVPEPEPDGAVFVSHIHANVFILGEGIII
jgi:hypothetical protein